MSEEKQVEAAPECDSTPEVEAQAQEPKAKLRKVKAQVPEPTEAQPEAPRGDPMMAQLVAAQRDLDAARKELESHRAKAKQYERDSRKQAVLSMLSEEFPGLPRNEIRGAALVAAEDGLIDLYSEDAAGVVEKLKEALRAKSKKTTTAATPSLGGTPGSAAKPPAGTRKFLI